MTGELDVSPDSLAAKAQLATSAFPVKEKLPKALTFSPKADDSDEHLPTPTPIQLSHMGNQRGCSDLVNFHSKTMKKNGAPKKPAQTLKAPTSKKPGDISAVFATFSINPRKLKNLGGAPLKINADSVKKLPQKTKGSKVPVTSRDDPTAAKRKGLITDNDSDNSEAGKAPSKKIFQDDKAQRFAAADKASRALFSAWWPKKTDATCNLDGVFTKPEICHNTDKKVDEEIWGCLVCIDMKAAGIRSGNGKIKCCFSEKTGVSTLRHWEAYQTHCQQIGILTNQWATPNNVKEMREASPQDGSQARITQYGNPI
ncbi:hypothetical protein BS47DRAFT_1366275 [Hydnum rufescens UP504]|uniref:Uncharacterized protein n=1 Tax=Hydnum rufescens UP504 TaxID=1448309 RepID=A0A9P6AMD9_9AGAM|nr:hypothetical protein BS47DRAFT_1366275 [Hydnum rufescens UP504]